MTELQPFEPNPSSNQTVPNNGLLKIITDGNSEEQTDELKVREINTPLRIELENEFYVSTIARTNQGVPVPRTINFTEKSSIKILGAELEERLTQRVNDNGNQVNSGEEATNTELENQLLNLKKYRIFSPHHIIQKLKEYKEKITKVATGYKSMTSSSNLKPLEAIKLMLNNPFYGIKSQEKAIEFLYLAKAKGHDVRSPVWEEDTMNPKKAAIFFSKIYLNELENYGVREAKKRTHTEAEKILGILIPPSVVNQYIKQIIKAPYCKEKSPSKSKK